MTAKKGTRISRCKWCGGTHIAIGNGVSICNRNSLHILTSFGVHLLLEEKSFKNDVDPFLARRYSTESRVKDS